MLQFAPFSNLSNNNLASEILNGFNFSAAVHFCTMKIEKCKKVVLKYGKNGLSPGQRIIRLEIKDSG